MELDEIDFFVQLIFFQLMKVVEHHLIKSASKRNHLVLLVETAEPVEMVEMEMDWMVEVEVEMEMDCMVEMLEKEVMIKRK